MRVKDLWKFTGDRISFRLNGASLTSHADFPKFYKGSTFWGKEIKAVHSYLDTIEDKIIMTIYTKKDLK